MPNCCGEVIKNQVLGKSFFYCRGCKKEVEETKQEYFQNSLPQDLLDELNSLFKSPPDVI